MKMYNDICHHLPTVLRSVALNGHRNSQRCYNKGAESPKVRYTYHALGRIAHCWIVEDNLKVTRVIFGTCLCTKVAFFHKAYIIVLYMLDVFPTWARTLIARNCPLRIPIAVRRFDLSSSFLSRTTGWRARPPYVIVCCARTDYNQLAFTYDI